MQHTTLFLSFTISLPKIQKRSTTFDRDRKGGTSPVYQLSSSQALPPHTICRRLPHKTPTRCQSRATLSKQHTLETPTPTANYSTFRSSLLPPRHSQPPNSPAAREPETTIGRSTINATPTSFMTTWLVGNPISARPHHKSINNQATSC